MSFMRDHIHEIEVVVEGVVVHRHGLVFIGVPGEVTVRHRSQPIEIRQEEGTPDEVTARRAEWTDIDPDDWPWGTE